jgi:hypothetical protein
MNSRTLLSLALALAIGVAAQASAQTKGPKLYRWVDKQGKIHYDQALPPEAVNEARREFNATTGTSVGQVDRALTPEERDALAAAAVAKAEAERAANEQKRMEDVMMASYETELDMRRAYGERINLLTMTIESTDISIRSLSENLATMLGQASDTELEGRRVLDERQASIREIHAEKVKQQVLQRGRRADLAALNAEFARMLVRYRQLRAPATAAAPAAASAPSPGG